MAASGITAATSSAARLSWLGSSGEKIEEMPTDFRPAAFISCGRLGDRRLVERHEGPAVIFVAAFDHPHAAAHQRAARSSGQSQNGGSEAEAGMPSRSAATLVR